MTSLPDLIEYVQAHPESTESLIGLIERFLAESTTADERQAIRQVAAEPNVVVACEILYFDGVRMQEPGVFVRQTIACLFMTSGYRDRETARRVASELRVFAEHHGVDFNQQHEAIRALPGVQRSPRRWKHFLLVNAGLFVLLLAGTVLVQTLEDPARIVVQLAVLLGVIGTQMAVLYHFYRM